MNSSKPMEHKDSADAATRQVSRGGAGAFATPQRPARSPLARFIPREEVQAFSAWNPSAIGGAAGAGGATRPAAPSTEE